MSSNLKEALNEKGGLKKKVEETSVRKKTLRVGDVCLFKISALAPNNVGIDEFSYSCAVFVPNAKYGAVIKAKILKIQVKESTYAVGQLVEEIKSPENDILDSLPVKPGEIVTGWVKPFPFGTGENAGVIELEKNYRLIVPIQTVNRNVKVQVTRVKADYGFAKVTMLEKNDNNASLLTANASGKLTSENSKDLLFSRFATKWENPLSKLVLGSKMTITLPSKSKQYGKFIVFKVGGSILLVKLEKGVSLGDRVRLKVISSSSKFAVAKILQVNPTNYGFNGINKKSSLVMNSIREMIQNGMHFGEKAVKCHARMKNYIWFKKQGQNKNRPLIKKGRHIINLLKTRRCLNQALNKLTKYALKGRTFLFIGTKKPAAGLVARASFFTQNSFYVNTRWLGGMLTNWKTICKSISKIRPILKEKQKMVRDILEKRQSIKSRLIKKALLLRKKSKFILSKGRYLLEMFKNTDQRTQMALHAEKLLSLRNEMISKGTNYLEKRQKLIQKRRELIYQTLLLKEKGLQIAENQKSLLNQLALYSKKLREYKYLLILTSEIQNLKDKSMGAAQKSHLFSVSYSKFKEVNKNVPWIVPNPPKDILNRIVLTMKKQYEAATVVAASNDSTPFGKGQSLITAKSTTAANDNTSKMIVCSTLLSKFSRFSSYIKNIIQNLLTSIQSLQDQSKQYSSDLNQIKTTLKNYLVLKNKYVTELKLLKVKFTNETNMIRIVKRKLKALDSYKKLIKFLPRLRYLPTPQTKISEIVQILLSRIVDPKLKYPIENIYNQKLSASSKKLAAARKKKWQRLEKYFGGIANMTKLTKTQIANNVAIIIGQKEEINAVRECNKLGIKIFSIVDTNCNPTLSDHIIPANDDSRNSIKYILTKFITRIRLAQKLRSRVLRVPPYGQNAKTKTKALPGGRAK